MSKNRKHLLVDYETFKLVMEDCVKEFLSQHPEEKGRNITQNHIVKQIALEYINETVEHY